MSEAASSQAAPIPTLLLRYWIGDREAIRKIAAWGPGLAVGVLLVLTAGIAREHDHQYVGDAPHFFLIPLVASLAIASIVYGSLQLFVVRSAAGAVRPRFPGFVSLFWLTAPLAWLYAIPAERMLDPVPAAVANLSLLVLVSTWRVALIIRVATILFEANWMRVTGAVLLPSASLVVVASISATLALVPIMGGITLAPETSLLVGAAAVAFWGGCGLAVLAAVLLVVTSNRPTPSWPERHDAPLPTLRLALLLLCFGGLAIPGQLEMRRYVTIRDVIAAERYREAIAALSASTPSDYPPTRRIPPDPQLLGSRARTHLPGIIAVLDGREAAWVRDLYVDYMLIQLEPEHFYMHPGELVVYVDGLARLSEPDRFEREYRPMLVERAQATERRFGRSTDAEARASLDQIFYDLQIGRVDSTPAE